MRIVFLDFDDCEMFVEDKVRSDFYFYQNHVTEDESCSPEISYIFFYRFYHILPERRVSRCFIVELL